MSNGFFTLQGIQTFTTAANRQTVGPFNIPFGASPDIIAETLNVGTNTFGVPPNSFGVVIIPPIGSPPVGVTMKFKTVLGDSGTFISTQQPTEVEWDVTNSNVPANMYLVAAGGTIPVAVQFV